jgi:hypothetical protein
LHLLGQAEQRYQHDVMRFTDALKGRRNRLAEAGPGEDKEFFQKLLVASEESLDRAQESLAEIRQTQRVLIDDEARDG